ncbi:MAG: hypothetical protein ACPG45_06495 [Flavobacteriaceae bacterium]
MKKTKLFIATILSSLVMTSCLVDDERPSFEEGHANTPYSVGSDIESGAYIFTPADTEAVNIDGNILLVGMTNGTYASSDIEVKYEIDATNEAVEGTMFAITNATNSFVIPAGQELAPNMLNIELYPSEFPIGVITKVVINIVPVTPSATVQTGLPFGQIELNVEKCDPPLSGTYSNSENGNLVEITPLGCNGTYRASYLTPFASTYWWEFTHDVSDGSIEITGWQFEGSNPLTYDSASVDAGGNITVTNADVAGVSWYQDLTWTLSPQ